MIVYKIFNKINWKVYVGITTCTMAKRWREHKCAARKENPSLPLYRAMKKHGIDNFEITKIDSAKTKRELQEKEIFWIQYYESRNTEFGYNLQGGGNLPYHSEESLKKQVRTARKNPPKNGRFKNVNKVKNGYNSFMKINGKFVYFGQYKTDIEAAWSRELNCKIYFKDGDYYSNFPNGITDELRKKMAENKHDYINKTYGVYFCASVNRWRATVPELDNTSRSKLIKQSKDKIECMCAYDGYVIKHKLDLPLNFNYGPNSYFPLVNAL